MARICYTIPVWNSRHLPAAINLSPADTHLPTHRAGRKMRHHTSISELKHQGPFPRPLTNKKVRGFVQMAHSNQHKGRIRSKGVLYIFPFL